jgi:hypothetical protein
VETGGRPDNLVDLEVDSLNKAVTPAGVHKYRGNFKGQYLGSGGWSPVAGDPKASPTQSFAVGTRYRARRRLQAACFVTDKGSCFTWSGARSPRSANAAGSAFVPSAFCNAPIMTNAFRGSTAANFAQLLEKLDRTGHPRDTRCRKGSGTFGGFVIVRDNQIAHIDELVAAFEQSTRDAIIHESWRLLLSI